MNERQYLQYLRLLKKEVGEKVCIRNEEYAEKWSRCDTIEDYSSCTLYSEFWRLAYECGDVNIIVMLVNQVYSEIYQPMIEREHDAIIKLADAVFEEAFGVHDDDVDSLVQATIGNIYGE